jgi:hypothetical protein
MILAISFRNHKRLDPWTIESRYGIGHTVDGPEHGRNGSERDVHTRDLNDPIKSGANLEPIADKPIEGVLNCDHLSGGSPKQCMFCALETLREAKRILSGNPPSDAAGFSRPVNLNETLEAQCLRRTPRCIGRRASGGHTADVRRKSVTARSRSLPTKWRSDHKIAGPTHPGKELASRVMNVQHRNFRDLWQEYAPEKSINVPWRNRRDDPGRPRLGAKIQVFVNFRQKMTGGMDDAFWLSGASGSLETDACTGADLLEMGHHDP